MQSESVKAITSPVAAASAVLRAAYDPGVASARRCTCGNAAATAAESSVEPLSTTKISNERARVGLRRERA